MEADFFRVVIPAYRESGRLSVFLPELCSALAESELSHEICVVDDGSGAEETQALLTLMHKLQPQFPRLLNPITYPENQGKGVAVYTGWRATSEANWLAFTDADGAVSAEEIVRVLREIAGSTEPKDAYFASRVKMLGRDVERRGMRHISGRVFANIACLLIDIPIYDSQCGFKVVSKSAFDVIEPKLHEKRFCFDLELLVCLFTSGFRIVEVPVSWRDQPGSKVSMLRDSIAMLKSLRKIRQRQQTWR
jgi:dolichyl-phosphate beta-glucosyltransferase